MSGKLRECFTPHVALHSLFGLGLGILLVAAIPELSMAWLGLVLVVLAVIMDYSRKN